MAGSGSSISFCLAMSEIGTVLAQRYEVVRELDALGVHHLPHVGLRRSHRVITRSRLPFESRTVGGAGKRLAVGAMTN